jgi:2-polyprenyl-3-methyl-5-hydroxy-6-metoxy-1,4-benzoquinol methylase
MMNQTHKDVQDYYGKELGKSEDLKTNACCTLVAPPLHIMKALRNVHDEVQAKYYGCGLTIPDKLSGMRVLDLGSGSGRDCYIAAQLVGETGEVIGVDMTDEQIDVANKYIDHHTTQFGFKKSNVSFIKGNIEKLDELGLEPGSFDIIISNCVINLAEDKQKVLSDAYNLLKPGGEMYFSDVYSNSRISTELKNDKVLWGECLSGALYWNDFLTLSKAAGFHDPRAVEDKPITIENAELENKVGDVKFFSVTYRLFKLESLEAACEDYGHAVKYLGSISESSKGFTLDGHHYFPKNKMMPVCGNTFMMLNDTRYKNDFEFYGTFDTHYGIYEGCGQNSPFTVNVGSAEDCC